MEATLVDIRELLRKQNKLLEILVLEDLPPPARYPSPTSLSVSLS